MKIIQSFKWQFVALFICVFTSPSYAAVNATIDGQSGVQLNNCAWLVFAGYKTKFESNGSIGMHEPTIQLWNTCTGGVSNLPVDNIPSWDFNFNNSNGNFDLTLSLELGGAWSAYDIDFTVSGDFDGSTVDSDGDIDVTVFKNGQVFVSNSAWIDRVAVWFQIL